MAKDRRSKGCPNSECERNKRHYLYKATDSYCTICGTQLVYVCPKCYRKLDDQGPKHIICSSCEAEREDRKNDFSKRMQGIGAAIGKGAKTLGGAVSSGAHAIKETAGNIREDIEEIRKNEKITLTLPEEYKRIKLTFQKELNIPKTAESYAQRTDSMKALLLLYEISEEIAMAFDDDQSIIDNLHETMDENTGLVEVGSGTTGSGNPYSYDIIKHPNNPDSKTASGNEYTVNFNCRISGRIMFLNGSFSEAGMTGARDSSIYLVYCRQNEIEVGSFDGWMSDPYDETYKKGFLMNYSEKKEFDTMFPDHPLSKARELIQFVIDNN